jgi:hypothetical protein
MEPLTHVQFVATDATLVFGTLVVIALAVLMAWGKYTTSRRRRKGRWRKRS